MKVLWFSNCQLVDSDISATGTWIQSMADGILSEKRVELLVIAFSDIFEITRKDFKNVQQWLIPTRERLNKNGLPSKGVICEIINICESFKPDLIHLWGVESFWGLLTARKYIDVPALLEMQGLKKAISKDYTADLKVKELLQCVGFKELIKRKIIISEQKEFARWGKFEEEIICAHHYIDVQSEWMSAQVKAIQPNAQQFLVDLALRGLFYTAKPWLDFKEQRIKADSPYIFFSSSGSAPYKGIHVALRAFAEIKQEFPGLRMHIAGNIQKIGLRQNGYVGWVNNLSRKLKVDHKIDWLGPISADQIITELQFCEVNLVCSFVESYCLALAEAMYLGVPCVTSFTGGTSWIAESGRTALFFKAGDVNMCAYQIERILKNQEIGCRLSIHCRREAIRRHDISNIVMRQLNIYDKIVNSNT